MQQLFIPLYGHCKGKKTGSASTFFEHTLAQALVKDEDIAIEGWIPQTGKLLGSASGANLEISIFVSPHPKYYVVKESNITEGCSYTCYSLVTRNSISL